MGAFSRFMRPKTKLFAVKFRRILKFSACELKKKSCGCNSTICASKNEADYCEIQTYSGNSLPARFTEKGLGAIPRFVRPKTKLFVVKFRRILEVL